jgi:hypothetical protein
MELKEALVELGLDPADRHDEGTVRRAYLRGVKVRKPETDPEGFRRLREAYELLRVFGPALARQAAPDVPAVELRSDSPPPPDLPPPPADASGVDPLTPYLDRLDALPAQPWLDRLAVAREAYRALPDHPRVEDLLEDIIAASNARSDQVVASLLPLVQEGDPASRWLLLTRHPKHVPLDELARLRREGTPGQRLATAAAYLEQDRADDAVATMEELLASDRDREGGLLLQYQALRFALALYRRSLLPQASRAFAAAKAYMGTAGAPQVGEAAAVTATLYLLCSELEAVPDLPKEFRQDVTRGVLEGDLGVTSYTVRAFRRMHGARATRRWHRTLKKQAPMIASVLQWVEPSERFSWGQMLRQGWWGAFLLIPLIRLIVNQSSPNPPQAYNNQIVIADPIANGPSTGPSPTCPSTSWQCAIRARTRCSPARPTDPRPSR